jgi:hypothetical protein
VGKRSDWLALALLAAAVVLLALAGYRYAVAPAAGGLRIEWQTENEFDIAGFNIYRAPAPDGPYVKINDALVPSSADIAIGASYSFVDGDVMRRQTYYYELETIFRDVSLDRRGPIELQAP